MANSILSKGPRCDNYHASQGSLTRCRRRAKYQLTLVDAGEVSTVYRCQPCCDDLHAQLEGGVTFAILNEKPLTGAPPADFQVSSMGVVLIGFDWAGRILSVTVHQWPHKVIPMNGNTLIQQLAEFLTQAQAATAAAQQGKGADHEAM
jgi:hypothetical protein